MLLDEVQHFGFMRAGVNRSGQDCSVVVTEFDWAHSQIMGLGAQA